MSGIVVVGAQWGDEGKGKIIDVFASKADMVVRYQGGSNAGHTLVVNGKKTVLHLIPSGLLHPETTCLIASGVVVDIEGLCKEIESAQAAGQLQNLKQLLISDGATVILPYHKALDAAREGSLSASTKIGTTGKGIGPAYEDRAGRVAIVMADLFDPATLKTKLDQVLKEKNLLLKSLYGRDGFETSALMEWIIPFAKKLEPHRSREVGSLVQRSLKAGRKVLFEGAQGTLLDVNHGTYPYVTSSSTLAGAACTGTGLGPTNIGSVIGIMKAYTTRVGTGPFPSELNNEIGERMRSQGHEFGSTTGRPRRCGWLDLVAMRYAIRINGITNLALMKLDVLTGLDKIGICTAYELDGEVLHDFPNRAQDLERVKPVVEYMTGWKEDLTRLTNLKDLPRAATNYIDFIGKALAAPIDVISVGPGREQTLWVKPLFTN